MTMNTAKTLKLRNVLIFEGVPLNNLNIEVEIFRMENYIKSKGCQPLGPHIQYTASRIDDNGDLVIILKLLRQASGYISNPEPPYSMESILRVENCMYVRFKGEESKLKFAYDKINLTAYEENIELKGDCYTVFVDGKDDIITADVFMEKKHDENA